MVHAVMAQAQPGEVLVLTMPEARPVALVGELLATQAKARGVVAMLVDASVRDREQLGRWACRSGRDGCGSRVRARTCPGRSAVRSSSGGAVIRSGDVVVLDADGAAVVEFERIEEVLAASRERAEKELVKRAKLESGALSFELDGLRERLEAAG